MALFRKQAMDNQKLRLEGDVFLIQPTPIKWILLLLVSIVALISITIYFGSYSRTENVVGHIVASKGLVKIYNPQVSILDKVLVEQRENVKKGQQLATLKIDMETQSGSNTKANILDILNNQSNVIESQISNQTNLHEGALSKLNSESGALSAEVGSFINQIALQKENLTSAKDSFEEVQDLLKKGFISKLESERRHQTWLSEQAQLKLREQDWATAKARLEQVNILIDTAPNEHQKILAGFEQQLIGLRRSIEEIKGRWSIAIYAPVDGVVIDLKNTHAAKHCYHKPS